jgi:suppressor of fused protein SUFU
MSSMFRRGGGNRPADPHVALRRHLEGFFDGHPIDCVTGMAGPIGNRVPGFRVFRIAPGPRFDCWTYVTSGCWAAAQRDGHGLEFALMAPSDIHDEVHLESLTMNAYYHAGPDHQRLDHGHTVPIGRPWSPGSLCDHLLVSLPYPFGPDFEICEWEGGHARLLWLLPITEAERDFKARAGLEALEDRFEQTPLDFLNPGRASLA